MSKFRKDFNNKTTYLQIHIPPAHKLKILKANSKIYFIFRTIKGFLTF